MFLVNFLELSTTIYDYKAQALDLLDFNFVFFNNSPLYIQLYSPFLVEKQIRKSTCTHMHTHTYTHTHTEHFTINDTILHKYA